LGTEICTVCCATGREESIDCPLSCEYLSEGHRHETKPDFDASKIPNQDIKLTEDFLARNEMLLAFIAIGVLEGALARPAATDWDVREALEALIQTVRAAQSGIIYEQLPVNPYAAGITANVLKQVGEIREQEKAETGKSTIGDEMLLRVLAFLQRLEYSHNNGRKRCRAFLDLLSHFHKTTPDHDADDEISQPDEPLIIL